MKIVATGRGGWEVDARSYDWQFEQARDGRGMLVFDHGWHQLAVAQWLFGPVRRVFAWLGTTEIVPGIVMDAPSTLVWEHDNGVRSVLEISFAVDTYFRSSHYTGDERVEATGSKGYVRCNRISAQGIQEPSVVVYRDGVVRGYHDLDDRPPDAFAEMVRRSVRFFRGEGEPVLSGADARLVLESLMAALESASVGCTIEVAPGFGWRGREMTPRLDHTIVWCRDKRVSARYLSEVLGLDEPREWGPFLAVELADRVSMDYHDVPDRDGEIAAQHYAFGVSEAEFDGIFGRLRARGQEFWADPARRAAGEINRNDGGRGVYFCDPDGHLLEIITRPYGSGG